jgi:hypothetical protein
VVSAVVSVVVSAVVVLLELEQAATDSIIATASKRADSLLMVVFFLSNHNVSAHKAQACPDPRRRRGTRKMNRFVKRFMEYTESVSKRRFRTATDSAPQRFVTVRQVFPDRTSLQKAGTS